LIAPSIISIRPFIYHNDPLLVALNVLAGKTRSSPYRVVGVDDRLRPRGVITGRRVLEVLLGYRGTSVRLRKGVKGIMREPVTLFIDEARHIFPDNIPVQAVLIYIAENKVGQVLIVDDRGSLRGVIDEESILRAMKVRDYGLKVEAAMTKDVFTISPRATLTEATDKMVKFRIRRLPVVDGGKLAGILTITDILRYMLVEEKHVEMLLYDIDVSRMLEKKVSEIMCPDVITVTPDSDLGDAIDVMLRNDVSGLLVVDKGELKGILSRIDVVVKVLKIVGPACLVTR